MGNGDWSGISHGPQISFQIEKIGEPVPPIAPRYSGRKRTGLRLRLRPYSSLLLLKERNFYYGKEDLTLNREDLSTAYVA